MLGYINKEKALKNIEKLLRESFYEGIDDDVKENAILDEDGDVDIYRNGDNPIYKFALEYLIRSKCFYSINHLMHYIEKAMEE